MQTRFASAPPRHRNLIPAAAVLWLASTSAAHAQSDLPLAFPIAESYFPAQLAGIDREWNLSFKTAGKVRVVTAAELAYWGRNRDSEAGPQIILADGGVIHADVLLFDGKQITIGDATGLGRGLWDESSLPHDCVRAILFQPPAAAADRDRLWRQLAAYNLTDDRLLLVGGETIAGTLLAAPRAGRFAAQEAKAADASFSLARRGSTEPLVIPAAKVVALSFSCSAPQLGSEQKMSAWLGIGGGSLLRADSISVKGDLVTVALSAGGELKTTLLGRDDPDKRFWDAVTYVEPVSSRSIWLSDQKPLGYKHIPFVSVEWPFGADQSVLATRLRAGAAVFRKGLGMPSASRLAFDVAGYRKFEAELAIDAAAGHSGSVVFKVLLETAPSQWRTAYESPIIRGGDAPLPISIDLKGAARLALIVEFADRGDECDYADWLMARLSK
jgi:NPCBM/NEW2 domain-containing protein